ncbi:zincin-like metallopeptidase domain-containing protein [Neisseria sp. Ec49-e6-T10]|uniref:zincin-like metallopeptidase domain-containing protein n=1 Tax=Neisseria sp. Ec49-e6-T10 TaxID=3140744 RepID=UPI003EC10FF5
MQTLSHELIHATKNKAPQFGVGHVPNFGKGDYNYGMEEWRAELGSVVLMTSLGASFDTKNSASYVHEWSDSDRWFQELTVEDRELKIMQAIEAANFLREKAGLNKVEFSEKELQELKEINEAFPELPKSLLKEHGKPLAWLKHSLALLRFQETQIKART